MQFKMHGDWGSHSIRARKAEDLCSSRGLGFSQIPKVPRLCLSDFRAADLRRLPVAVLPLY